MPLLENHIAVVTGAGTGIGAAIARGFAREGAHVVVLDIDRAAAAETAAAIKDTGGKAQAIELDVSDNGACVAVARRVADEVGSVSVLVNNAGIFRRSGITGDPASVMAEWRDTISTNLTGTFNVTHAFLPALRANKGRIINLGSIQSFIHARTPSSPAYTASKHGLLGFTRALAAELGKEGVRVNALGPGYTETAANAHVREQIRPVMLSHIPLGRAATPEDIVGPAIFLASDMSAYVTGHILVVDGGRLTI